MKNDETPDIWLQEHEPSGQFSGCKCRLEADYAEAGTNGSPAFFMCPLHAAAPELLEAVKDLAGYLEERIEQMRESCDGPMAIYDPSDVELAENKLKQYQALLAKAAKAEGK